MLDGGQIRLSLSDYLASIQLLHQSAPLQVADLVREEVDLLVEVGADGDRVFELDPKNKAIAHLQSAVIGAVLINPDLDVVDFAQPEVWRHLLRHGAGLEEELFGGLGSDHISDRNLVNTLVFLSALLGTNVALAYGDNLITPMQAAAVGVAAWPQLWSIYHQRQNDKPDKYRQYLFLNALKNIELDKAKRVQDEFRDLDIDLHLSTIIRILASGVSFSDLHQWSVSKTKAEASLNSFGGTQIFSPKEPIGGTLARDNQGILLSHRVYPLRESVTRREVFLTSKEVIELLARGNMVTDRSGNEWVITAGNIHGQELIVVEKLSDYTIRARDAIIDQRDNGTLGLKIGELFNV